MWVVLFAGWAAAVWWLSSQTDPGDSLGLRLRIPDKLAHGIEFAVGGFLARGALRPPGVRWPFALAVVACGVWGVVDEWHQGFVPGRDSNGMDVVADVVGAALGSLVHALPRRQRAGTPVLGGGQD